jgi:hypothetical protein
LRAILTELLEVICIDGTGPDFWRPRPVPVWKSQTGPDRTGRSNFYTYTNCAS